MSETKTLTAPTLQDHLAAWEQSELSLAEYARRHGIPVQRLYQARYLRKPKQPSVPMRSNNKHTPAPTAFLPVSIAPALHAVSITLPSGVRIHLQHVVSMADMVALIQALQP
jgi:hypothetical protein